MNVIFFIQIVSIALIVEPVYCDQKSPKLLSVEVDYAGDSGNVSTDEIVLKRSDGSTTFLTENGSMERVPVLSHDNSVIAFLRRVDSDENGVVNWNDQVELWLMRLNNRAESRLAVNLSNPSKVSWHPSKMKLTFIATNSENVRGLYVYDLQSKLLNLLSGAARTWPAWSPQGDHIAYYNNNKEVVVYNVKKKRNMTISENVGNSLALYWTLDNRLVFDHEDLGAHIYKVESDRAVRLTLDPVKHKFQFVDQEKFGWADF